MRVEKVCSCGASFLAYRIGQPTKLCPPCRIARNRKGARRSTLQRREADPVAFRAYHAKKTREWRAANPGYHRAPISDARKRAHKLKSKFGITPEAYTELLSAQKEVCAICQKPERVRSRRLAVDHCHKTGRVRGLLCAMCNTAIGKLGDSPELLRRALEYLEAT